MESEALAPKVKAIFQAVIRLIKEGADLNNLTVAEIAAKAGIGKGTVYEYFQNKEDVIAQALFHQLKTDCREMYQELCQEKDLYTKMNLVLLGMEKNLEEINCFVRSIHIMMDNSVISGKMRKMAEEKKEGEILIVDMIRCIIDNETGSMEGLPAEKSAYLMMSVFSKLICFVLYQFDQRAGKMLDSVAMREMICRDVCRDIENVKKELAW
ncbi:HTH-type transcriptional regulator BetI [Lachnospiraceae bacterium]|nr:HTH-type transcriptional regulator BetI [Lachnospiraceae bacterium]